MTITVTIPEPLEQTLHTLAAERGIPAEVLAQEVLLAGIAALQKDIETPAPVNLLLPLRFETWTLEDTVQCEDLGALHPTPLPDGFAFNEYSPVIASGPVPVARPEPFLPVLIETSIGEMLNLGPIYPDASLEEYRERMSKTRVQVGCAGLVAQPSEQGNMPDDATDSHAD